MNEKFFFETKRFLNADIASNREDLEDESDLDKWLINMKNKNK